MILFEHFNCKNIIILFLLPLLTICQGQIHAPYQIGLFLFDNYNPNFGAKNFPICSAAIIHPLFSVTTADCVHAHITKHNIARPFLPTSIYVKSGNFSEIRDNIKYVRAIHIHPEFNGTTLKNDIALVQVEASFQFDHLYTERWVELANLFTSYEKCIYSINTPNSTDLYPFTDFKRTTAVNNSVCYGNASEIDSTNICSFYEFDHPFMCQIPADQLRLSRDRGTPLICDNKLAGLLSIIIPANTTNSTDNCARTLKTNAAYVNVALYEKWIHSIIGINSPEHTADGKPINLIPASPPYQNHLTISKPIRPGTSTAPMINGSCSIMVMLIAFVTCLLVRKFSAV
ncbi:trypsin-like isoform X2 [Sitodiplosis mosellana]|uniref:trypsin-like isoform X2 n=1 Tax=Sitodiplosis mosellana TaxID=263140 RepID=UPI00244510D9|nr:trypsin-like isoform X2 [Sitodiplosis mosellana]